MISFANEIGNLCSAVGETDVVDVMNGVHLSRYLTPPPADSLPTPPPAQITSFLEAGCGFGGSCLPKDVRALIAHGEQLDRPMRMLRAAIDTNEAQPDEVLRLLDAALPRLRDARVTVLGLAFKPDTGDVRESPAFPILDRLLERGAIVTVHDPVADELPDRLESHGVRFSRDLEDSCREADAIVLVTRWQQFQSLPDILSDLETPPLVVDGRRMLDKHSVPRYVGIGL